jgi:DNA-directed RNA polymerase specialized sigma24 family protein
MQSMPMPESGRLLPTARRLLAARERLEGEHRSGRLSYTLTEEEGRLPIKRYGLGLGRPEVARALEIPGHTVRHRERQALRKLRALLELCSVRGEDLLPD